MRSDWHRYNLKRRVASLPPISSEVFTEKVLQARASTSAEADRASFEKLCTVCQKTYFSENSYRNHLGSAKHRAREFALQNKPGGIADDATSVVTSTFSLGDPAETKTEVSVDSDAEEEFSEVIEGLKKTGLQDNVSPVPRPTNPRPSAAGQSKEDHPISVATSSAAVTPSSITPTPSNKEGPTITLKNCLFCNYESPTVALNANHMEKIHGMFIPERQYLVDLEGLLSVLQQRVLEFHECLYCGKVKANAFAAQTHMRDIGHCKIPYTTEQEQLEIGEFYDFRSTYSDEEESDEDEDEDEDMTDSDARGGARLGAKRSSKTTGEDGADVVDDEGWETDSSESSLDSEDLHAVPAERHDHQYERLNKHPHHARGGAHRQRDGWHSHAHKPTKAVFYDEYELHLPNGKSVGHRSLNRYYRQNLHSHPSPEERAERERLRIEAAENGDAMDVDGEDKQVATRDENGRAVVSRTEAGMAGVDEATKKLVRKEELRARKQEHAAQRKSEWRVNKEGNHQKYFHYSIL